MTSPNVIDLTPQADQMILVRKYGTTISFPDRLPATLVPTLLKMQAAESDLDQSADNIVRMTEILARLINRANPDLTEEWIMDWLDVQDVVPLIQRLLNPTARPTQPTSEATAQDQTTTDTVVTRTRKK